MMLAAKGLVLSFNLLFERVDLVRSDTELFTDFDDLVSGKNKLLTVQVAI